MSSSAPLAKNKVAYFNYAIHDKIEAGIVLKGSEVKSIRLREITLKDSFARVIGNELWLFNCYIKPYPQGSTFNPEPERDRKLLLKRKEIDKLIKEIETNGRVVIPLLVYLSKQNKVKVLLGLGEPKKMHDKRKSIKDRETKREIDRAIKSN
ncbi:SsrA-binding protein SmpB [bacterium]|jgi:SsrA-binding protein|nr:SsrA-binding protein SmpB [bacterium]